MKNYNEIEIEIVNTSYADVITASLGGGFLGEEDTFTKPSAATPSETFVE